MENFDINHEKGTVAVSVNPKLYSLDVVYSAAYIFTDKCYIILDGDPHQEILVELKPKLQDTGLETIGREFNNELINYANYELQFKRNARLREVFLHKIMVANTITPSDYAKNVSALSHNTNYLENEAKPWKKEIENENRKNNSGERKEPTDTFV